MRRLDALLQLTFVALSAAASDAPRPRGVGPDFAEFYKSTESFTCITDPSIHLNFSQVNDDFCDCPDGSDEPGTAACSFISPLSPPSPYLAGAAGSDTPLALPGYYCKNKGHIPGYVPFAHVNDGVCDHELCCDGSDEWAGVGGVVCDNKCKEIGKEWRNKDEQRKRALSTAAKKRKELVEEAARLKKQVEGRIGTIITEIQGAEKKVAELEKQFREVERSERGKIVKTPGKGKKIVVLAGLAQDRVEELRESLVAVRAERNEAREKLKELETILSTFKEERNPNFNDEGVKRAVRSWEDYAARQLSQEGNRAEKSDYEADLDEISKKDGPDGGINWDEWEEQDTESDVDILYKFEAYVPHGVRDWVDQKLRDLRAFLVENGILAASDGGGSESKVVTDARQAFEASKSTLESLNSQLNTHREDLTRDYGADEVFRGLKGTCIETESGEYTYEMCWLDRTTQKSKKGGGNTGMGNFVRFDTVHVDEDIPADGRGLGTGNRVALRYEGGQNCWNGPDRSTTVILACADKDELWKIMEEEKCVYRMEVGTPAVCDRRGKDGDNNKSAGKDEL